MMITFLSTFSSPLCMELGSATLVNEKGTKIRHFENFAHNKNILVSVCHRRRIHRRRGKDKKYSDKAVRFLLIRITVTCALLSKNIKTTHTRARARTFFSSKK